MFVDLQFVFLAFGHSNELFLADFKDFQRNRYYSGGNFIKNNPGWGQTNLSSHFETYWRICDVFTIDQLEFFIFKNFVSKNQFKYSPEWTNFVSIFKRKRGRIRINYSKSSKSTLLSHSLRQNFLTCFMFYAPLGNVRICEYTPPFPPDDVKFEKCPGDLEKFPDLDLGGNFRICEYTPPPWWHHIREFLYVVNMNEIWRKMSHLVSIMPS